ncbi:MAG: glycosyltransferase family 39 protein [Candidatus Omnitrophica bacterium]|nr:glycosyltransferase family 39 protein [Candidatus Omnitrophota bacterium]
MAILFPVASFLILSCLLSKFVFLSRREACLLSAVACSFWVWLATEFFSLFRVLNATAIMLAWLAFLAGILFLFFKQMQTSRKAAQSHVTLGGLHVTPVGVIIAAGIFIILLGTLLLALFSPPNTWDTLTYHMSRVVHWAQNGTLAPYPTHIPRQVFSNPGFEYFVLHSYLLAGGDAWANCVQWIAMLGSLMVVTLIAKQLSAGIPGQLLALAVAATIPMGIVEASSLQGDYMVAFFLCAALYALLRWRADSSWIWAMSLGVASGLAILTKGTGIFFILPVLIWLVGSVIFADPRRRWSQVLGALFLVAAINSGFILRTVLAFPGRDLSVATQEGRGVLNESFGPDIFLINVLRHAGLHAGTSSEHVNKAITAGIRFLPAKIGVNIDDPRATYASDHFEVNKPSRNEDLTSAGVHVLLLIVFFLLVGLSRSGTPELRSCAVCLLAMAALFCLAVKWQPWLTRLQLPFFVVASPGVGVLWGRVRFSLWPIVMVSILFLMGIPYVINAYPRHLLGKKSIFKQTREEQYFTMSQDRYENYLRVVDRLAASGCHNIGLVIGSDDWEYPLWPLLKKHGMGDFRLEHVEVAGPLGKIPYPRGDFTPCARVVVAGPTIDAAIFKK